MLNLARLNCQCREQKKGRKPTFLHSNISILIWGVDALKLDRVEATDPQAELPGRREGKLQKHVQHIWPLNYMHPFSFHLLKTCWSFQGVNSTWQEWKGRETTVCMCIKVTDTFSSSALQCVIKNTLFKTQYSLLWDTELYICTYSHKHQTWNINQKWPPYFCFCLSLYI